MRNTADDENDRTPTPGRDLGRAEAVNRSVDIAYDEGKEMTVAANTQVGDGEPTEYDKDSIGTGVPTWSLDGPEDYRPHEPWLTKRRARWIADRVAATFVALTLATAVAVALAP